MSSYEDYVKKVQEETKATWGKDGFIGGGGGSGSGDNTSSPSPSPQPAATAGGSTPAANGTSKKGSALVAKFFSAARGARLSGRHLPPSDVVAETMKSFTGVRQAFFVLREKVHEEVELSLATPGVSNRKRARDHLAVTLKVRELLSTPDHVPKSTELRSWHRWLKQRAPTSPPTQSLLLSLEERHIVVLFHAVTLQLLGRSIAAIVVKPNADGTATNGTAEAKVADSDEEDEEEDEEEEEEDLLPIEQRNALILVERLCGASMLGLWLFGILAAIDVPLTPTTEVLMQDLLRSVCSTIRTIAEARGVAAALSNTSSREAFWSASQPDLETDSVPLSEKKYKTCVDIGKREMAALYTVVLVLGKFFRQASSGQLPLA